MTPEYAVKDQYVSALLLCFFKEKFRGTKKAFSERGHKEMWFTFSDPEGCEALLAQFQTDQLSVNPREFVSCLTRVREMYKSL